MLKNRPLRKEIEIMSPAGSYEALAAAINAGAGSVYFGIDQLNMRAHSTKNFTMEDLPEIVKKCKKADVKSYLTVNSIIYDEDLETMEKVIIAAREAGVTAIIGHDMAVLNFAVKHGIELHLSTQSNVSNIEAVKFYSKFADVIVLARELNLDQVKEITDAIEKEEIEGPSGNKLKIEIFIHGALCMAVSGKCYLSLHENNHSANRGACLQICRRKYTVTEKKSGHQLEIDNEHIMSPKDLCTISFLDKILDSGARVLKIEGRGRSPEYVKRVTEVYNEAINAYLADDYKKENIKVWEEKLETVFNRGFWDGYYLGRKLGEWNDTYGSNATKKKIHLGTVTNYYKKIKVGEFIMEADDVLHVGDEIAVIGPTTGVVETVVNEIHLENKSVETVKKGDHISIPITEKLRPNDILYKYISLRK